VTLFIYFQFAPLLLPSHQTFIGSVSQPAHSDVGLGSTPITRPGPGVSDNTQVELDQLEQEKTKSEAQRQEAAASAAAFARELAAFEARRSLAAKEKKALDHQQQLIRDQAAALELQRISLKLQQDTLSENQRALKQNQEAVARAQEQRERAIAASALRAAQHNARRVQEEEVLRHADQVLQLQAVAVAAHRARPEQEGVAPLTEAARAEQEQQEAATAAAAALVQEHQALEVAAAELLALNAELLTLEPGVQTPAVAVVTLPCAETVGRPSLVDDPLDGVAGQSQVG